jgi:small-conductance mechanosensitive channel
MNNLIIQDDGHVPLLCKYKDALGIPKKGIHSYRIFGMAIADIVMTIIGFGFLSYIFGIPLWKGIAGGFILGIIAHRAFCVRTTVDKWLFPEG